MQSPQPSPRELETATQQQVITRDKIQKEDVPSEISACYAGDSSGTSHVPLPGSAADESAQLSLENVRLLAELAVRDAQLAVLRNHLRQTPEKSATAGPAKPSMRYSGTCHNDPPARTKNYSQDLEQLDSTRRIDPSLIEKLRFGATGDSSTARQVGQTVGQHGSSTGNARRRVVSYGVAADVRRAARKRLVAELQVQPHTRQQPVHVPVEVMSNRRAASLPPICNVQPRGFSYMKPNPSRSASTIAPEINWWMQACCPLQETKGCWGGIAAAASPTNPGNNRTGMHKTWLAQQHSYHHIALSRHQLQRPPQHRASSNSPARCMLRSGIQWPAAPGAC